ncbi:YbaB/EbfC family nucleoid-associated protein [Actinoplanes sp. NPDC020271]|uniref:YbaB/EbfC family nucleoid-associated protein n=1 Tax=Actinoplanes sp. NPDC020271 TaxID=3363896 RepID=UPI0037B0779F
MEDEVYNSEILALDRYRSHQEDRAAEALRQPVLLATARYSVEGRRWKLTMDGVDAAEEWLDSWARQTTAQAARGVELSRRVAALTGSAEGHHGAIRVVVGPAGQMTRLELDDQVHELSGPRLAQEIMAVTRSAQADLSRSVAEEVRATVGTDTETGQAVLHSFEARFGTDQRETGR